MKENKSGNVLLELLEAEKLEQHSEEDYGDFLTKTTGDFLTLICC